MRRFKRLTMGMRAVCVLAVLALAAGGAFLWSRPDRAPVLAVETRLNSVGQTMRAVRPAGGEGIGCVIAASPDGGLSDAQLLELSAGSGLRLVQFHLKAGGSGDDQRRLYAEARAFLGGEPKVLAGMKEGAAFAYRWLAGQKDDEARAISVEFSLDQPDCPDELPPALAHGTWDVVWNNGPDDDTGLFLRKLPADRLHVVIGAYGADPATLLLDEAPALLGGDEELPVTHLEPPPGAARPETAVIFYSGDGGWRDLDQVCGEYLAAHGFLVAGVDTLKLFWQHKTPEQSAQDLARIMDDYRRNRGAKRFVLAGYSFGADIMPALYNRLSPGDRESVTAMILLAFSRAADFEIAVSGWLGGQASEMETGPEMSKVPPAKVFCIYGAEEKDETGCLQPQAVGENLELPGGHHFDEDYDKLADIIMKAVEKRTPQTGP